MDTGLNIARAGTWYPYLNEVECRGSCCADKPAHARIMKCSGQNSFEAHCGKNPKQWHWRDSFKVEEEGTKFVWQTQICQTCRIDILFSPAWLLHSCKSFISCHAGSMGMTVERYMGLHGISLRKRKKSSTPQTNPPASSTPNLGEIDPSVPLATDPQSASRTRQQSGSESCDQEGCQAPTQHQQVPYTPLQNVTSAASDAELRAARQNLPFPTADSSGHAVDGIDEAFNKILEADWPFEDARSCAHLMVRPCISQAGISTSTHVIGENWCASAMSFRMRVCWKICLYSISCIMLHQRAISSLQDSKLQHSTSNMCTIPAALGLSPVAIQEEADAVHGTKADCIEVEIQDVQLNDAQQSVVEATAVKFRDKQVCHFDTQFSNDAMSFGLLPVMHVAFVLVADYYWTQDALLSQSMFRLNAVGRVSSTAMSSNTSPIGSTSSLMPLIACWPFVSQS